MGDPMREDRHLEALLSAARTVPVPQERLAYGTGSDQFIEIYGPDGAARTATHAVFFIHGGYFRDSVSLAHARPLAWALSERGALVGLVEYRRAGGAGGRPRTLDDITTAIETFTQSLATLGLPADARSRLVVSGHSAGGCLALTWASHLPTEGPEIYVRPLAPVSDLLAEVNRGFADGAVLDYMGVHPEDDHAAYLAEDPRSRAACIPPRVDLQILHGTADATVDIAFTRNFPAARLELSGADHFDLIDPSSSYFPKVAKALKC